MFSHWLLHNQTSEVSLLLKKKQVCGTSQSLNETDFYHVPHFLSLTKYFTSAKCCMRKHALIEITFTPAMCYYKILVPKSSSTCQQVRLFFLSFLIDGLCKNNQGTHKIKQTRSLNGESRIENENSKGLTGFTQSQCLGDFTKPFTPQHVFSCWEARKSSYATCPLFCNSSQAQCCQP